MTKGSVAFRKNIKANKNDRDITVTKGIDGLYIEVEGYLPSGVNKNGSTSVQRSIVFVDTLYPDALIKIWSHPDVEDYTHNISIKERFSI